MNTRELTLEILGTTVPKKDQASFFSDRYEKLRAGLSELGMVVRHTAMVVAIKPRNLEEASTRVVNSSILEVVFPCPEPPHPKLRDLTYSIPDSEAAVTRVQEWRDYPKDVTGHILIEYRNMPGNADPVLRVNDQREPSVIPPEATALIQQVFELPISIGSE